LNSNTKKTLIFDLGGVILNLDLAGAFRRFSSYMEGEIKDLHAAYRNHPFIRQFELGVIDEPEFRDQFRTMLRSDHPDDALDDLWSSMLVDIPGERIDWIARLKKAYRVVILSNTNSIHIRRVNEILRRDTGIEQLQDVFDHVFYSYEIHERKPDRAIYNFVLDHLDVDPLDAVLFDDSKENLSTAAQLGMGVVYVPQNQLTFEHLPNGGK